MQSKLYHVITRTQYKDGIIPEDKEPTLYWRDEKGHFLTGSVTGARIFTHNEIYGSDMTLTIKVRKGHFNAYNKTTEDVKTVEVLKLN